MYLLIKSAKPRVQVFLLLTAFQELMESSGGR